MVEYAGSANLADVPMMNFWNALSVSGFMVRVFIAATSRNPETGFTYVDFVASEIRNTTANIGTCKKIQDLYAPNPTVTSPKNID